MRPDWTPFELLFQFTILSNTVTMSTSTCTFLLPASSTPSPCPAFVRTLLGALSYNAVWTATGTSPFSGWHEGKHESITKALKPLHDRPEASPKSKVERMIANG